MHQWNGAGAPTMPVGCRKSRQAVNAAVRPSGLHRTLERLGCSVLRPKGLCGRRTRFELLPVIDWGHPAERGLWECILIKQDDGTVCYRSVVGGGDCGSDSFLAEPEFPHRLDAAGPVLFGRLRYPVVNSKRFCGGRCPRGPCGRCLACRDRIQQCWCLRYIGVSSGCFGPPSLGIGNHFAR